VAFALRWCELDTNLLHESLDKDTKENTKKKDTKEPKKNKENEKENSVHKEARPTCMGPTPGSQDAHFGCSIKKGKPQCSFGNSPRTCLGQFKHQNTSFGIMTKNYATLFALLLFCMPNACLATRSDLDATNYSSPTGSQNGTVGAIAMGLSTFDVAWCNGALSVAGSAQRHLACEVTGGNDIVSYNYLNGSCAGVIDGKWPPICVSKGFHLCFGVYLCSCFTMLHLGSSFKRKKRPKRKGVNRTPPKKTQNFARHHATVLQNTAGKNADCEGKLQSILGKCPEEWMILSGVGFVNPRGH